ncbi:hypothetical protein AYI70_g9721 [Smittium culicis]|uniref:Uncharacterized protein n=1 Tax=Smittium culicis TaxID=133412 RepID=A0A1R1X9Y2_9FUNG|nr:hypothetical protein AYI70_g9721 [Smittium culicis]
MKTNVPCCIILVTTYGPVAASPKISRSCSFVDSDLFCRIREVFLDVFVSSNSSGTHLADVISCNPYTISDGVLLLHLFELVLIANKACHNYESQFLFEG